MFDIARPYASLIFTCGRFRTVWHLLADEDALDAHFQKTQLPHFVEGDFKLVYASALDRSERKKISRSYEREVQEAREHYANMMLVSAYTHFEDIVETFFYEAFLVKPKLMIQIIKEDGGSTSIALEKLIDSNKDDLIRELSKSTASKLKSGSLEKVFKRIQKISKINLGESLVGRLSSLQIKRNKIVHEARLEELSQEDVEAAFGAVGDVLKVLGSAAKKVGVELFDADGIVEVS